MQELAQELAQDESVDPEAIRQGEAAMAEAEANHPRPALKYLSECFNLSLFEETSYAFPHLSRMEGVKEQPI
ncbi:MAG: hypothetical protein F6J94_31545 [Moorea sp. SIO1F2]|uniref:hypothetical protein n=1 Tax=Moorena sp. SIO1F2 TaxID=2607819 RepID=UPI0013B8FC3D|nr:hypothetical protein [Moorena sp. SIO1F2]NET86244.1 hypothetical protein [Moorena sp. SIO1F2]